VSIRLFPSACNLLILFTGNLLNVLYRPFSEATPGSSTEGNGVWGAMEQ